MVADTFDTYLQQLQQAERRAYLANMRRKAQIEAIYNTLIQMYQPGGAFEARFLSQLGARKTRDVGSEMQQLISSGLYGTTTAAGIGRRWEAEVGEPARLGMEDVMQQRLASALTAKAGFLEGIEEPYPDYGALAALAAQAAAGRGGGGGGGYSRSSGGTGGLAGSAGPAWVQEASARMAAGIDYTKPPGSQRPASDTPSLAEMQAQKRAQQEAYDRRYASSPPIQTGDIIWGEEEAAKLLAKKAVPSTAKTLPTVTEDIMKKYPATKYGPYKY